MVAERSQGENVGVLYFEKRAARLLFREAAMLLAARNRRMWLAAAVQEVARYVPLETNDGVFEATQTKLQGIATWTTHGIFGAAVLAALWVGALAVDAGRMAAGDMVVFMMYALMMRGPIVRLARQGCRTGKALGTGYRLVQLFSVDTVARTKQREPLAAAGSLW